MFLSLILVGYIAVSFHQLLGVLLFGPREIPCFCAPLVFS